jgi:hypothetical protein
MVPQTRVGLGPGEPVEIPYDHGRPIRGVISGSPRYRVKEAGAVVPAVDLGAAAHDSPFDRRARLPGCRRA